VTSTPLRPGGARERAALDRGWYYVREADGGVAARAAGVRVLMADDGAALTRRAHGHPARVVLDASPDQPRARLVRATATLGRAREQLGLDPELVVQARVTGGESGVIEGIVELGPDLLDADHHAAESGLAALLAEAPALVPLPPPAGALPPVPVRRALFFESLMNSDLPHNDRELSQGVLHMIAPLGALGTEVCLANVKMSIEGRERPVAGMEGLEAVLQQPVELVCITLLEGYFEGVQGLVRTLRGLGCRAHIAVGGVMPSLAPEHVAAHLGGVSFVCRGAGEVIVPQLCRILGAGASVDQPFTAAQRHALSQLQGLFAFDPGGGLVAARPDVVVTVGELDRVALDLSHLERRHVEAGFELTTSRGCIHRCTFCSILGRERYQARSAGNVIEVLAAYEARFQELFAPQPVPPMAYRLHIADDDFACDKARAAEFFAAIRETPFRLSSVQVAIGDLCLEEGGRLLPVPDPAIVDAIVPEIFADSARVFPPRDFVADHKSRRWSSYLQIGVETFSDRELARLGKGYTVRHVRAIAATLARKGIHFDAYLILSNADTTGDDLVDVLLEVSRHKLRFPFHFHARFPVVPRLVSYFTAASHRRLVRRGRSGQLQIRRWLRATEAPELDYPLVDHDEPADPWVEQAVAPGAEDPRRGIFTDDERYLGSLRRLQQRWQERLETVTDPDERTAGERLLRRLDDAPRRLIFELLADARDGARRQEDPPWPGFVPDAEAALATATTLLGPKADWMPAFKRFCHSSVPRMVVIPTWQCELRCGYCFIPKQDGREMAPAVLDQAVDLLLSSDRDELMLQFFGGEALLEWELVQRAIRRGTARARELGKRLTFILSSNGWSLTEDKLTWLKDWPVKLELSLDGKPDVQNRFRRAAGRGQDSYDNGIAHRAELVHQSGLPYDVIMVVHPKVAHRVDESFLHIASLGYRRIQINFALGFVWTAEQQKSFAAGLMRLGKALLEAGESAPVFINAEQAPMPIRLNGEVTVDHDGTIYGGNAFLHETEHKSRFRVGHVDQLHNFDRYWMDAPDNDDLLAWSYPPEVTKNNLKVGALMTSFIKWFRKQKGL
jgi:pyruvate-formate lyase-activating enzyme